MNNSKEIFKLVVIFTIGLLVGAGTIFFINNRNVKDVEEVNDVVLEQAISAEEAGEKVLNVINQHMLAPGITASLVGAVEERGLYKITVDIQGQEETLYLTKDGTLLFPQVVDLNALLAMSEPTSEQEQEPQREFSQKELKQLTDCLIAIGAKFFGTAQCPWCIRQKEMFGEAAIYLPYVECSPEHGATAEELALCKEANVTSVPDWRFPDKEPILGMLSIERLIELSGC